MNSRQRYNMKRMSEYNARKSEIKQFSQKIERAFSRLSEDCSNRVLRATSLGSLRDYQEPEATEQKQSRIYYRDANPLGNKIHAVQKMKLSSKPLI